MDLEWKAIFSRWKKFISFSLFEKKVFCLVSPIQLHARSENFCFSSPTTRKFYLSWNGNKLMCCTDFLRRISIIVESLLLQTFDATWELHFCWRMKTSFSLSTMKFIHYACCWFMGLERFFVNIVTKLTNVDLCHLSSIWFWRRGFLPLGIEFFSSLLPKPLRWIWWHLT